MVLFLVYDMKNALRKNWVKYLLFIFAIIVFYAFFVAECVSMLQAGRVADRPTLGDGLVYLLRGMHEYHPEFLKPFEVPVIWLAVQLVVMMCVGTYASDEMAGMGQQLLLRSRKKGHWLLGKVMYCAVVVTVVYVSLLCVLLVGAILGVCRFSLKLSPDICYYMSEMDAMLTAGELILYVLVLPIVTSFVVAVGQVLLSITVKPIIAFVAVVAYQVSSAYFSVPVLVGAYSMVLRSKFCTSGGFTAGQALGIEGLIFVFLIIISIAKLKRQDFLVRD